MVVLDIPQEEIGGTVMAVGNGNPGISKLAKVISGRSSQYAEDIRNDLTLDFGRIQADKSLLTNSFPIAIPKGEYSILRHVGGMTLNTTTVGVGDHGSHRHTVTIPKLKPGDHVLVAWVNKEPVVLDVVQSSSGI